MYLKCKKNLTTTSKNLNTHSNRKVNSLCTKLKHSGTLFCCLFHLKKNAKKENIKITQQKAYDKIENFSLLFVYIDYTTHVIAKSCLSSDELKSRQESIILKCCKTKK